MNDISSSTKERYVFIDALRGVAALAVLFHHLVLNSVMQPVFGRILPHFLVMLANFGALGVQIFFVLSGFVIAHSLRNNPLTLRSLSNFALRRQIRLDLPYWFMLAIILLLHRTSVGSPPLGRASVPPGLGILCNFFYLQNIAGVHQILGVAWTLCIEIQFYLAFISLLCIGQAVAHNSQKLGREQTLTLLIFTSGVASLVAIQFSFNPVWFMHYWFYFASGVLCYRAVLKIDPRWVFPLFLGIFLIGTMIYLINPATQNSAPKSAMIVGLNTVAAIYLVGMRGKLTQTMGNTFLQYFGRISYSLYLVHLVALTVVLDIGYKISGDNPKTALIWMIIAFGVSIGCAQLLFFGIERPSMRLSSRFKIKETSH